MKRWRCYQLHSEDVQSKLQRWLGFCRSYRRFKNHRDQYSRATGKGTSVKYEVLTAVLMKVQVVCSVTPCLLVNTDISVEQKCLSIRGKVIQQDSTSPKRRQQPADTALRT
jgi:hypothetical protein